MMSMSNDRLRQLEQIEKDLASAIHSAGQAVQEISKEKPSLKQVESHATSFLKTLSGVEKNISKQIETLQQTTGQPHEGSCYASQKLLNMAWHRMEHTKTRLTDLDRLKAQHIHQINQIQMQQQAASQQQQQQQQPPQHFQQPQPMQ